MMPRSLTHLLVPCALLALLGGQAGAQSSSYRGLWVGEASLSEVNEVSVPLDENNIPRAPNPEVTTPTSDLAKLRLILHVDASGQVSLLKHVAILARKAGEQVNASDLALVTDERLYGSFPPQAAKRISSVAFDFGDPKATMAVTRIAEAAASTAAGYANAGAVGEAAAVPFATAAAQAVIDQADASADFADFLADDLTPSVIRSISTGGSTTAARDAADLLASSSFYNDQRGHQMIDAILAAVATLSGDASNEDKEQMGLNAASAFIETDLAYDRFLASELFGDMIAQAAENAAQAADDTPATAVDSFQSADSGAATAILSVGHGLADQDEVAVFGAAVGAYNGVHVISEIDDDQFSIPVPFVTGAPIDAYAGDAHVAPVTVLTPGHGLTDGDFITIRDCELAGYDGRQQVTVIDNDRFSINEVFVSDPAQRGSWSVRGGEITGYVSGENGVPPVKVMAPDHGLNNGETITILDVPEYEGSYAITRVDDDSFTIDVAFAGNPADKGSWEVARPIQSFLAPSTLPTLVSSPGHGLGSGDRVVISGSGYAAYNTEHEVTVIDADLFRIETPFDNVDGDPATKGSWQPASGGSWRPVDAVRDALGSSSPKVTEAKNETIAIKVDTFDTRAADAVDIVLDAIFRTAATEGSALAVQGGYAAAEAGWNALANEVPRFEHAPLVPSTDYNNFIATGDFTGSAAIAGAAATEAAYKEAQNVISTPESIESRALDAAIEALIPTYAAASRALMTSLPMSGSFGPGESDLAGEILLPAVHPTNPFRHRRHPDHAVGVEVRREINIEFLPADAQPLTQAGYGVDRIAGIYNEEIHGLHKPLGPDKDIGLKVRGRFELQRISLIDTLNGR